MRMKMYIIRTQHCPTGHLAKQACSVTLRADNLTQFKNTISCICFPRLAAGLIYCLPLTDLPEKLHVAFNGLQKSVKMVLAGYSSHYSDINPYINQISFFKISPGYVIQTVKTDAQCILDAVTAGTSAV